jgi:hypothetical protein
LITHVVPQVRTTCTGAEAAEAFWYAHQHVIGGTCPIALLVALVCKWDVETAGGHDCFGNNLGNMRGHGPDGATQSLKGADEIIDGVRKTGAAIDAGFAAYVSEPTPLENRIKSAEAIIRFLGTDSDPTDGRPNRFAGAWAAMQTCNLEEYAHQAGKDVQGPLAYFTASPKVYAAGLRSREARSRLSVNAFIDKLNATLPTEPSPPPTEAA